MSTSPLLRREELTLASCLQERLPEAAKIMTKYVGKWFRIVDPDCDFSDTADSSPESNDESSDLDSD